MKTIKELKTGDIVYHYECGQVLRVKIKDIQPLLPTQATRIELSFLHDESLLFEICSVYNDDMNKTYFYPYDSNGIFYLNKSHLINRIKEDIKIYQETLSELENEN